MPRAKRKKSLLELQCANCHRNFAALRDDAQTCGATCRQQLSREKRAARSSKDKMRSLRNTANAECKECGTGRDARVAKCPVCSSTKIKKLK